MRASPRLERPGARASLTPGHTTAPTGCGCPPQRVFRAAFTVLALGIYGCIPSSLPQPLHPEKAPRLNALHRKPSPCVPSDAAMGAATAPVLPQPTSNHPPLPGTTQGHRQAVNPPGRRPMAGHPERSRGLPDPRTPVASSEQSMMETSPIHGIPDSMHAFPRLEGPEAQASQTPGHATAPSGCGCLPQRVLRAAFPALALGIYGCIPSSLPLPMHPERTPRLNALHRRSPFHASRRTLRWGQPRHPGRPSQHPTTLLSLGPPKVTGKLLTPPDAGQWRVVRRDPGVLPTPEPPLHLPTINYRDRPHS
ncbi:hypothetical protein MMC22_005650 [Lobaria immixta]|nr:hypothetical protein [Lobaria immixta]